MDDNRSSFSFLWIKLNYCQYVWNCRIFGKARCLSHFD